MRPEIDDLVPSEASPRHSERGATSVSSFPIVLRRRLDSFFSDCNISPKADRAMWLKIALGLAVLAGSWIGIYALKLNELAQGIFDQLAPDERDLRQVITTLRTAHAVAWDMYDAVQAARTTVEQYMSDLRQKIQSFEQDLDELQRGRAA